MKVTVTELKKLVMEAIEAEMVNEMDMDDEPEVDYKGNGVRAFISDYGKVGDKKYSVTIEIRDPQGYIDEETFDADLDKLLVPWMLDNFAKADIEV